MCWVHAGCTMSSCKNGAVSMLPLSDATMWLTTSRQVKLLPTPPPPPPLLPSSSSPLPSLLLHSLLLPLPPPLLPQPSLLLHNGGNVGSEVDDMGRNASTVKELSLVATTSMRLFLLKPSASVKNHVRCCSRPVWGQVMGNPPKVRVVIPCLESSSSSM